MQGHDLRVEYSLLVLSRIKRHSRAIASEPILSSTVSFAVSRNLICFIGLVSLNQQEESGGAHLDSRKLGGPRTWRRYACETRSDDELAQSDQEYLVMPGASSNRESRHWLLPLSGVSSLAMRHGLLAP